MVPALDGSLEKWLRYQLVARLGDFEGKAWLIDVGAYQGDFAASFCGKEWSPFTRAVLFEPNPDNLHFLRERFASRSEAKIENLACDQTEEAKPFFCAGPAYTGSLLPYGRSQKVKARQQAVQCVALDQYLERQEALAKIGLLKIDTQGNDLRVLRGAQETLRLSRPWIVVELIFVPLYQGQSEPNEIGSWLASRDYVMAAQFNEHYLPEGWLAWADACFIPRQQAQGTMSSSLSRPTAEEVERKPLRLLWRVARRNWKRAFGYGRH